MFPTGKLLFMKWSTLLPSCEEKQHKNQQDGSWEGWTSERRMLGIDDKTMEFRDTDEWGSLCHQICCLKITSKQINMSGWERDRRGGKMREEERRVRKETAWPMQLPAATRDPGEPQVLLKGVFKIDPQIHSIRGVHSRSLTFSTGDR